MEERRADEGSSETGEVQGRGSWATAGGEATDVATRAAHRLPAAVPGARAGGGEAGLSRLIREEDSPDEVGRTVKCSNRCSGSIGSNNCREISVVRKSELREPNWYRLPEWVVTRRRELDRTGDVEMRPPSGRSG